MANRTHKRRRTAPQDINLPARSRMRCCRFNPIALIIHPTQRWVISKNLCAASKVCAAFEQSVGRERQSLYFIVRVVCVERNTCAQLQVIASTVTGAGDQQHEK